MNTDIRLSPTAAAVILDGEGRVLLTRRVDNGKWCLPSGHMEVGETIGQTVVRETREETGLEVVADKAVGIYSAPHPYYVAKGTQPVAIVFLCRVTGGELSVSDETTGFGWFMPSELPPDIVPTHPERIVDAMAVRAGAPFCVR